MFVKERRREIIGGRRKNTKSNCNNNMKKMTLSSSYGNRHSKTMFFRSSARIVTNVVNVSKRPNSSLRMRL